ncbi:MAG: nucleotidyltransferase domain-containing protein [Magnetococcales bacterium]|nr:nucleotidyltransferase domain-containing protein [Magnetococcales bacterium]
MIQPVITEKLADISHLCVRHGVHQLDLFGSAVGEAFDPKSSDLDFLVEFVELTPAAHADAFFGLMEDLEKLFGRAVDLVEKRAIRNPYFQQTITEKQINVFHAI